MLTNAEYHQILDALMEALVDAMEAADKDAVLECELAHGAVTIVCPGNKTLVVSRQTPVQELWYASPRLGGLHFTLQDGQWVLKDGREFHTLVRDDLKALAGVVVP